MGKEKKVFIYFRNHTGDPCPNCGIFGANDCMGEKRNWLTGGGLDAVIGFGVPNPDKGSERIADKVTWIGIGPREVGIQEAKKICRESGCDHGFVNACKPGDHLRGKLFVFKKYEVMEGEGPDMAAVLPETHGYFSSDEGRKKHRGIYSSNLEDPIRNEIVRYLDGFDDDQNKAA